MIGLVAIAGVELGESATELVGTGFRIGKGGWDFGFGRTGVTSPSGGGPSISMDTFGCGRGGSALGLTGGAEVEASDLCFLILSMIEVLGTNDGSGACSIGASLDGLAGRGGGSRRTLGRTEFGSLELGDVDNLAGAGEDRLGKGGAWDLAESLLDL